jgi:thioredoxin 1
MKNLLEVKNETDFNEQLKSNKLVLVDFYGTWCAPCKMINPIIKEIAETYDNLNICKIDVDENTEIAAKYGVRSIPTLLIFKDGEIVKRQNGALPKSKIVDLFKDYI